MRLQYTTNPPSFDTDEENTILNRVITRRDGKLISLDRTLLHAPFIADGWNSFMIAIRTKNSLPAGVRELAFCRVIALTQAWYEWEIHSPIAKQAGVSAEALAVIEQDAPIHDEEKALNERQRTVVKYTDAVTLEAVVPDDVFTAVRKLFSDKEIVELTVAISGFNTVARFVTALDVGEINGGECPTKLSFRK